MSRVWSAYAALLIGVVAILALAWLAVPARAGETTCGRASYYGTESGNRTANGEAFDGTSMTAAHRSLPFGSKLRVTYKGRSVVVRVNDRGGFHKYGRILDLSRAAAERIGMVEAGVASVCFEVLR